MDIKNVKDGTITKYGLESDKPTKAKKKMVEKAIEQVVDAATNKEKRVRKPPTRLKAR